MTYQGNDAGRIVVGANGTVYVSDITATAPTDATTDLGAVAPHDAVAGDWVELGFVAENGVVVTPSQAVTPVMVWQSSYPARKIITSRGLELDFILRELSNPVALVFAMGGGSVVEAPQGGAFTFTPPLAQAVDLRSLCLDWQDGTRLFRLYIPNGQVVDLAAFTLSRTAPAELPVKFQLNHSGTGAPYNIFSNDAGLEGS